MIVQLGIKAERRTSRFESHRMGPIFSVGRPEWRGLFEREYRAPITTGNVPVYRHFLKLMWRERRTLLSHRPILGSFVLCSQLNPG